MADSYVVDVCMLTRRPPDLTLYSANGMHHPANSAGAAAPHANMLYM
jgi:hypothetical protein